MRRALAFAVLVGVGATVWAGLGTAGGEKIQNASATNSVTISNEQGTTWTCGFSPFNADVQPLSFGVVYEELVFVNGLKSGKATNWLASNYKWSNGNKTLTFTIRSGVKWTDGKPFSADDVIFTYDLLKKFPALDLNADWAVLKSVTKQGNKIVFKFKTSAVPYFYYIAAQTPIVAKHIWSSIKNPVTYKDSHPIGTGPFKMSSCSPQVIKYTKNGS
jgi:peptide/nickel transport system substrate-binding protein